MRNQQLRGREPQRRGAGGAWRRAEFPAEDVMEMGRWGGPRELAAAVGGAQGGKAEKQGCEYRVCKRLDWFFARGRL